MQCAEKYKKVQFKNPYWLGVVYNNFVKLLIIYKNIVVKLKKNFIMKKFMWIRPMKNNEIGEKFDSLQIMTW